ncbi:hypothetical protein MEU_03852 [Candida albicans P37005]|uniref:Uncharacterized protein n=1 Tax=Candida albicans (strain SC5314 / ATCC MYA-2876) TaxID=237561 RepID=A0A1D8PMI0_CANAL|nr:uncharacterized protein CAALFM_C406200WA [Candida albicans SC5314]AOW29346.1 hypothetical protein CAALFM_C406200WA [Candida albicans SC5314]KGQ87542.1 hypothetical protein MEU_03852 [Candida albicans P37005]|eukprot:XP_019330940.1 hypothetical protein CAALFM_C406200WA [Candida albicans SC5314]
MSQSTENSNIHDNTSNPYSVLTQKMSNLKEPINELLRNHEELLVQHLGIANKLSSIPKLTDKIESSIRE